MNIHIKGNSLGSVARLNALRATIYYTFVKKLIKEDEGKVADAYNLLLEKSFIRKYEKEQIEEGLRGIGFNEI